MRLGKTSKMNECTCLNCGSELDMATDPEADSNAVPKAGDISVCLYCGHLAVFTDNGLRELTSDEMHDVAGDERLISATDNLDKVRYEIYKRKTFS